MTYHQYLAELIQEFKVISFSYVPRTQNQFVDALATLAFMIQLIKGVKIQSLQVQIEEEPAFCTAIESAQDNKPWGHDIRTLLQIGCYLEGATNKDNKNMETVSKTFSTKWYQVIQEGICHDLTKVCRRERGRATYGGNTLRGT